MAGRHLPAPLKPSDDSSLVLMRSPETDPSAKCLPNTWPTKLYICRKLQNLGVIFYSSRQLIQMSVRWGNTFLNLLKFRDYDFFPLPCISHDSCHKDGHFRTCTLCPCLLIRSTNIYWVPTLCQPRVNDNVAFSPWEAFPHVLDEPRAPGTVLWHSIHVLFIM